MTLLKVKFDSQILGPTFCVDNSSHTTRPIESSVQSPKYVKISSQQSSSALRYQMRDPYNRRKRLADWIKRVNEDVDDPDRTDILKLIEHMQDRERSISFIFFASLKNQVISDGFKY